jgi:hypothetical protein
VKLDWSEEIVRTKLQFHSKSKKEIGILSSTFIFENVVEKESPLGRREASVAG